MCVWFVCVVCMWGGGGCVRAGGSVVGAAGAREGEDTRENGPTPGRYSLLPGCANTMDRP